jgi:amino acid adenylation domain-containing protein
MAMPGPSQASLVQDVYPLSPTQQGLLFHSLLDPDAGAYLVQVGFTLAGALDRASFASAWQALQTRHDVLRTAFAWERLDQPMQVVGRKVPLHLETIDLRNLGPAAQTDALRDWLRRDRERGFDLHHAPLMRVTLFELGDGRIRVVWTYHHLLLDGWSLPLLLREWTAFYLAAEQGTPPALPPPAPYRDYIAWLRQQDRARALDFWRDELRGFTAPTPLTMGAGSRAGESSQGQLSRCVESATTRLLQAFARRERLTLSTLVQGAWSLLLHRYSGERDLVFGLARSGRPPALDQFGQRVGLFLNLLPMRVRVDDELPVRQFLARIQQRQVAQQDFEYAALRDVHEVSEVVATMPLFESIVVFENYPSESDERLGKGRLQLSDIDVRERTNYPLNLYAAADKELELRALYDTRRFPAPAVDRLLWRMQTLLSDLALSPERRLGELPTLTDEELIAAHVHPNQTRDDRGRIGVDKAVANHAREAPARGAVICGGRTLDYGELDRQANRLAHYLLAQGVEPAQPIGICVSRSVAMPVALLAVMRCGCPYVPMDAAYPLERLRHIIADAGMTRVVVDAATHDRLSEHEGMLLDIDAARNAIAGQAEQATQHKPSAGDLAYLIYTSGSTGLPKGVEISHANLDNLLAGISDRLDFGPTRRLLAVTTLAFDIAALELMMPLLHGGCVVIADDDDVRDGSRLAGLLADNAIDVMQATPATWRLLLAVGWPGAPGLKALCGGEALDARLARELLAHCSELWNLYGPTETTIWSAALRITPALAAGEEIPIGKPLANTVLHVLDASRRPLPPGIPGELYIGGQGLGRGYHGRATETAKRFIRNPLAVDSRLPDAPILYRTGDQVRQRDDGLFDFLGRLDLQAKVRGFRIELGEIESVLLDHGDVERAVAEVIHDDTGDARLVAVVQLRPGCGNTDATVLNPVLNPVLNRVLNEQLRDHLAERLPAYMVPSVFRQADRLPVTPNGKLDRAAVRRMDFTPGGSGGAPRTPIERSLAEIWRSLLGSDKVGPDDNFFEIGGHSLMIVQARGLVRERLGVELELLDLFHHPTLRTLAGHVAQLRVAAGNHAEAPVTNTRADRRLRAGIARRQAQRARRQRKPPLPQQR